MSNRVAILAVTCTALAAVLGACATRPSAQAAAVANLRTMENAALARQQANVIPANGMLPIDDVVGFTVLDVEVTKAAAVQDASLAADNGSELVVVSYKLINVTPQGQTVPDWNRLLLVDAKGQTYKPDAVRTSKLVSSCSDCAQVGGPVGPSGGEVRSHAVFQVPAGAFDAKTWVASWQQDEAAKIRLPETQTASARGATAPGADTKPAKTHAPCQAPDSSGCVTL